MIPSALVLATEGWALVALLMLILWLIQRRTGNAAIVDFGWALSLVLLAGFHAIRGDGFFWRSLLITWMGAA